MAQSQPMRAATGLFLEQVTLSAWLTKPAEWEMSSWLLRLPSCKECPPENKTHTEESRDSEGGWFLSTLSEHLDSAVPEGEAVLRHFTFES